MEKTVLIKLSFLNYGNPRRGRVSESIRSLELTGFVGRLVDFVSALLFMA